MRPWIQRESCEIFKFPRHFDKTSTSFISADVFRPRRHKSLRDQSWVTRKSEFFPIQSWIEKKCEIGRCCMHHVRKKLLEIFQLQSSYFQSQLSLILNFGFYDFSRNEFDFCADPNSPWMPFSFDSLLQPPFPISTISVSHALCSCSPFRRISNQ